jgi:D-serine deaminase-like pyridoxal phosphate-dependent protein
MPSFAPFFFSFADRLSSSGYACIVQLASKGPSITSSAHPWQDCAFFGHVFSLGFSYFGMYPWTSGRLKNSANVVFLYLTAKCCTFEGGRNRNIILQSGSLFRSKQLATMHHHYPRLRLDEDICRRNIAQMAGKARKNGLLFRPHFKTHQSLAVSEWFRDEGVSAITVSSIKMAEYFADGGWDDLFIAFPANILEMDAINRLAGSVRLMISVESRYVARYIAQNIKDPVAVSLKIDTGYHRTGLDPNDTEKIGRILETIAQSPKLSFRGFYTHSGNTYKAGNKGEVQQIFKESAAHLARLRNEFLADHPDLILSTGDTPSCSVVHDFGPVDEIRPGNFVFYDLMQAELGACQSSDVAVVLECPVLAKNSRRNELLIHGGAVHLSKEAMNYQGENCHGLVVPITPGGWGKPIANTLVTSLSQEHGIIRTDAATYNETRIGDTLGILPVHSCLTANLADQFYTTGGKVITKMRS